MKDNNIKEKVIKLTSLVIEVNKIMSELQDLNVEVRIQYVEPKDNIKQGISMWRCVEHNDYLKNE